jgi:hypothetical protein
LWRSGRICFYSLSIVPSVGLHRQINQPFNRERQLLNSRSAARRPYSIGRKQCHRAAIIAGMAIAEMAFVIDGIVGLFVGLAMTKGESQS